MVVAEKPLLEWASENDYAVTNGFQGLLTDAEFINKYWKALYAAGKEAKLHGFEQVKNIILID